MEVVDPSAVKPRSCEWRLLEGRDECFRTIATQIPSIRGPDPSDEVRLLILREQQECVEHTLLSQHHEQLVADPQRLEKVGVVAGSLQIVDGDSQHGEGF